MNGEGIFFIGLFRRKDLCDAKHDAGSKTFMCRKIPFYPKCKFFWGEGVNFLPQNIITVRNSNCGKVMFLKVSVCPQGGVSVYGSTGVCLPLGPGVCLPLGPGVYTYSRQTPPRWPLQQTVRMLLECILVPFLGWG